MDKRSSAGRAFGTALKEAEQAGLTVTPKDNRKVYVHNPVTGEGRIFAQEPGGARGLPNALSMLRKLREGAVPRVGREARIGPLDGLFPVRNAEEMSVPQRAYMVWHHANQWSSKQQAQTVKARIDTRGKLQLGSRSRFAAEFYAVDLDRGISMIHDALFPSMKHWKNGKEACMDYLRLSGNAYYLNASSEHGRRWLIRVEWNADDAVEVPEPDPDAPQQERRTLPPPQAPQTLTTYRCRFVGCAERDFITEKQRDDHERDHTSPQALVVTLPPDPYPDSAPMSAVVTEVSESYEEALVTDTPVPRRFLTGDDNLDAAFMILAEAVRERINTATSVVALSRVEADLASRLREVGDENARLKSRVRDLEEFVLRVEQYVEDGQPMRAIEFITQFFSGDQSVVA